MAPSTSSSSASSRSVLNIGDEAAPNSMPKGAAPLGAPRALQLPTEHGLKDAAGEPVRMTRWLPTACGSMSLGDCKSKFGDIGVPGAGVACATGSHCACTRRDGDPKELARGEPAKDSCKGVPDIEPRAGAARAKHAPLLPPTRSALRRGESAGERGVAEELGARYSGAASTGCGALGKAAKGIAATLPNIAARGWYRSHACRARRQPPQRNRILAE